MPRLLHVVARTDAVRPDPLAEDLLLTGTAHRPVRVLELVDVPAGAAVTDLSLSDRHLPEVVAALHWATEVHTHRVHPAVLLENLPFVRPEVLDGTPLVVHGPVPELHRSAQRASARLEAWPGPCYRDQLADPSSCPPDSHAVRARTVVDRSLGRLLPRACGPRPLQLDEGRWLATVGLCAELPESVRQDLKHALATVSRPELEVEVVDEATLAPAKRAAIRRTVQAFVVPAPSQGAWCAAAVEAVAQGLPLVALGQSVPDAPPGVVWTTGREPVDRCVSCIRSWAGAWATGEPAPVDLDGREPWLLSHSDG